ncbi:microsomal glutathione S-transferase 3-like isoform X2 [Pomacea canaliculata]|uniref:microsomal glutathione S-transferase 3-like isoform X2 n=1 Tax=Pomacea canaliculata TaxID=400727 RepID=UPI000D73E872|nr:microsomal glutathione S-transferase 3-like isoform X2 [Pomacea canaliculata]
MRSLYNNSSGKANSRAGQNFLKLLSNKSAMGVASKFAEALPRDYGYVLLVGCVGNVFVNMWLAINVGRARKQYEVAYPEMTSSNKTFNCIQRAHQHAVENEARFLTLLFVGGLQYPRISAAAGLVYLLGRVVFALGYYTGDPEKRRRGGFMHLAELCLLGNSISFICHQLKWV